MCGFAGVIAWDEKYRVSRDTLEKMSCAIAHRGPDGEGYHLTREHEPITPHTPQTALAFRRLAVIDPDPRSDQPFHIGPLTLVFNGEIYNFRELKSEISKLRPDYRWRTTGDTEVLLMAYDVWREQCVEKLNGMFAFAVWDEQKKELFLARDRMGQKPLYVSEADGAVAFASEPTALRFLNWIDWKISPEGLCNYLRYGCTERFFENCWQHAASFTSSYPVSGIASQRCYFDPSGTQNPGATGGDCRQIVHKAVARQLVSDVPLGVFLSGGTDSSVIAAAARSHGPVRTFCIAFDDPRYDESEYARQVAAHLRTDHYEFRVTPRAAEDLPKIAAAFGEPFADSSALPMHYLARQTRQHVKVALSGDGGDEMFGGYDRYRALRLSRGLRPLGALAPLWRRMAAGHPKSAVTRAGRFLLSLRYAPEMRYDSFLRIFDEDSLAELIADDALRASAGEAQIAAICRMYRRRVGLVRAALATDRVTYLPNDLLTKVDRCSMLHGLEVRSPFMDHELMQFAAGLTADQLLKGGSKRMLREAFAADLPDFVFKRPKMGFAVPIGQWFRGQLRAMLRDNLFACDSFGRSHFNMKFVQQLVDEHEQNQVDHSQRLYALLMLELWWRWHKGVAA